MSDCRRSAARNLAAALAVALLAACASKGTVVLLPEADGRQTAVAVRQGDSAVVLDRPYAGADLKAQGVGAYQSRRSRTR